MPPNESADRDDLSACKVDVQTLTILSQHTGSRLASVSASSTHAIHEYVIETIDNIHLISETISSMTGARRRVHKRGRVIDSRRCYIRWSIIRLLRVATAPDYITPD
jgi:hypothetical protein